MVLFGAACFPLLGGDGHAPRPAASPRPDAFILMRQVVLTGSEFQRLISVVKPTADQQRRMDLIHEGYDRTIRQLTRNTGDRLIEAGLHHVFDASRQLDWASDSAYLASREQALRIITQSGRSYDAALQEFDSAVTSLLDDDQLAWWRTAQADWHRRLLFDLDGEHNQWQDLWRHADVIELVRSASAPHAEFESLLDDADAARTEPAFERVRIDIAGALADYASRLEADFPRYHRRHWQLIDAQLGAYSVQDFETVRRLHVRRMAQWRQIYEAGCAAAVRIATSAETVVGKDAAQRWLRRFYGAYYKRTDHPASTERLYAYIADELAPAGMAGEQLRSVFEAYEAGDRPLRERSRHEAMAIRMRFSPLTPEYSFFEPMTARMRRLEAARRDRAKSTNALLIALLPTSERVLARQKLEELMASEGVVRWGRF